jgi:hypothetical protein
MKERKEGRKERRREGGCGLIKARTHFIVFIHSFIHLLT